MSTQDLIRQARAQAALRTAAMSSNNGANNSAGRPGLGSVGARSIASARPAAKPAASTNGGGAVIFARGNNNDDSNQTAPILANSNNNTQKATTTTKPRRQNNAAAAVGDNNTTTTVDDVLELVRKQQDRQAEHEATMRAEMAEREKLWEDAGLRLLAQVQEAKRASAGAAPSSSGGAAAATNNLATDPFATAAFNIDAATHSGKKVPHAKWKYNQLPVVETQDDKKNNSNAAAAAILDSGASKSEQIQQLAGIVQKLTERIDLAERKIVAQVRRNKPGRPPGKKSKNNDDDDNEDNDTASSSDDEQHGVAADDANNKKSTKASPKAKAAKKSQPKKTTTMKQQTEKINYDALEGDDNDEDENEDGDDEDDDDVPFAELANRRRDSVAGSTSTKNTGKNAAKSKNKGLEPSFPTVSLLDFVSDPAALLNKKKGGPSKSNNFLGNSVQKQEAKRRQREEQEQRQQEQQQPAPINNRASPTRTSGGAGSKKTVAAAAAAVAPTTPDAAAAGAASTTTTSKKARGKAAATSTAKRANEQSTATAAAAMSMTTNPFLSLLRDIITQWHQRSQQKTSLFSLCSVTDSDRKRLHESLAALAKQQQQHSVADAASLSLIHLFTVDAPELGGENNDSDSNNNNQRRTTIQLPPPHVFNAYALLAEATHQLGFTPSAVQSCHEFADMLLVAADAPPSQNAAAAVEKNVKLLRHLGSFLSCTIARMAPDVGRGVVRSLLLDSVVAALGCILRRGLRRGTEEVAAKAAEWLAFASSLVVCGGNGGLGQLIFLSSSSSQMRRDALGIALELSAQLIASFRDDDNDGRDESSSRNKSNNPSSGGEEDDWTRLRCQLDWPARFPAIDQLASRMMRVTVSALKHQQQDQLQQPSLDINSHAVSTINALRLLAQVVGITGNFADVLVAFELVGGGGNDGDSASMFEQQQQNHNNSTNQQHDDDEEEDAFGIPTRFGFKRSQHSQQTAAITLTRWEICRASLAAFLVADFDLSLSPAAADDTTQALVHAMRRVSSIDRAHGNDVLLEFAQLVVCNAVLSRSEDDVAAINEFIAAGGNNNNNSSNNMNGVASLARECLHHTQQRRVSLASSQQNVVPTVLSIAFDSSKLMASTMQASAEFAQQM